MAVKKAYTQLVELLQANKDKKVSSILDQVIEMTSAKGAGGSATAFHKDEKGNVVAIRCSYFGLWMPTSHVKFGAKAGSASGFNSMSQEGVNNFGKQQRDAKKAKEQVLERVAKGELKPDQIQVELERIEAERKRIIPHSTGIGFKTLEECLAASPKELDAMVAAAQPEDAENDFEG